ncbi:MAG: hypothetical protein ABWY03_02465 [Microbacterium sp.]
MPKQLINTIGTMIVIAIFAIGVAAVGVPLLLQSLTTTAEAGRVADVNAGQEAEIADLAAQSDDSSALNKALASAQAEIPPTPLIYTVSELVSDAADRAGVTVTGITPNAPAAFTGTQQVDVAAAVDVAPGTPVVGRAQIPVEITVIAGTYEEIVAFVDELREGPRLLGDIELIFTSRGGADATVKALAFADIAANSAEQESGEGE